MSRPVWKIHDLDLDEVARFWSKVDVGDPRRCWLWSAPEVNSTGYGRFTRYGTGTRRRLLAHRLAYALFNGDPGTQVVRHDCDTPLCCNPHHMQLGTQADNVRDAMERGHFNRGGLELGWRWTRAEHPCADCGALLPASRNLRCAECAHARDGRLRRERDRAARMRARAARNAA